jgi:hypothetical protein
MYPIRPDLGHLIRMVASKDRSFIKLGRKRRQLFDPRIREAHKQIPIALRFSRLCPGEFEQRLGYPKLGSASSSSHSSPFTSRSFGKGCCGGSRCSFPFPSSPVHTANTITYISYFSSAVELRISFSNHRVRGGGFSAQGGKCSASPSLVRDVSDAHAPLT